jgi:hypothetical protein
MWYREGRSATGGCAEDSRWRENLRGGGRGEGMKPCKRKRESQGWNPDGRASWVEAEGKGTRIRSLCSSIALNSVILSAAIEVGDH